MARDKESMQDNAMWAMDKINKENPSSAPREKTLAEMLTEEKKSPDQRRRELSKYDWSMNLKDFLFMDKYGPGQRLIQYCSNKYKEEIEKLRTSGAPYKEVSKFMLSKGEEFLNYRESRT